MRTAGLRHTVRRRSHLMAVKVTTAIILMVVHTVELLVCALAYAILGAPALAAEDKP